MKEATNGLSDFKYTTKLLDVETDLIGKMMVGFKWF